MAKKPSKPEFYSRFMEKDFFPEANKNIKYHESHNYWIFKTGQKIYKVKKREEAKSTASLEEIFCQETVRRLLDYSPALHPVIATIKQDQQGFQLDLDNQISSAPLYYVIIMDQLADRYFLSNVISKGKLTDKTLDSISKFLFQLHENASPTSSKDEGTSASIRQKLNDLIYQSKKYLGDTISQPMIDMTLRPLEKYIVDNRKLLLRRNKRGLIREVHGCFTPRKIYANKEMVLALAKTTDPLRNRYCDIVSDIADLTVELIQEKEAAKAAYFIDSYCKETEDREIKQVLPIYQALKCLSQGLKYSILFKQGAEETKEEYKRIATAYYEQAIEVVHQL
jgi:aminoglycoside phosphotransferase family enzyme